MENNLPPDALSIMQPWAWLIVNGHKDVENRDWKPWNPGLKFRGPVCIHAGKKVDEEAFEDLLEGLNPTQYNDLPKTVRNIPYRKDLETGGIVGVAEIVDVVTKSESDWFCGPYGLVIANARPIEFIPCKGALGFFKWEGR